MKNTELKQEFHMKLKRGDPYTLKFFSKLSEFEEKYDKDLFEFSTDELLTFLYRSFGGKDDPVTRAVTLVRQYTRFVHHKNENIEDLRNYRFVEVSELDEMWATMFGSPDHLANTMDQIFYPVENDNADICLRCFLWLAYAEVDDVDALTVTENDIDLNEHTVTISGEKYPIYEQAVLTFQKARTLTSFMVPAPKNPHYVKRVGGNLLLRGKLMSHNTSVRELNAIRAEIARINQCKSQSISYNNVRYSGMFHRVYQLEMSGKTIDPQNDFVVFENRRKKAEKTDEFSVARREYRELLSLRNKYKTWKKAFHS